MRYICSVEILQLLPLSQEFSSLLALSYCLIITLSSTVYLSTEAVDNSVDELLNLAKNAL